MQKLLITQFSCLIALNHLQDLKYTYCVNGFGGFLQWCLVSRHWGRRSHNVGEGSSLQHGRGGAPLVLITPRSLIVTRSGGGAGYRGNGLVIAGVVLGHVGGQLLGTTLSKKITNICSLNCFA